jgi:hypothetical protein
VDPKLVRTVGRVAVSLGTGAVLCQLFVVVVSSVVVSHLAEAAKQGHQEFDAAAVASHALPVVAVHVATALAVIASGVAVLCRRTWARVALEGAGWLIAASFVYEIIYAAIGPAPPGMETSFVVLRPVGVALALLSMLPAFFIFGLFIWFIRRASVRAAFQAACASSQPNHAVQPPAAPSGNR